MDLKALFNICAISSACFSFQGSTWDKSALISSCLTTSCGCGNTIRWSIWLATNDFRVFPSSQWITERFFTTTVVAVLNFLFVFLCFSFIRGLMSPFIKRSDQVSVQLCNQNVILNLITLCAIMLLFSYFSRLFMDHYTIVCWNCLELFLIVTLCEHVWSWKCQNITTSLCHRCVRGCKAPLWLRNNYMQL